MSAWVFALLLCCPFGAEHEIRFSAPTKTACDRMRIVINREIRKFGLNVTRLDAECVEAPSLPPREPAP